MQVWHDPQKVQRTHLGSVFGRLQFRSIAKCAKCERLLWFTVDTTWEIYETRSDLVSIFSKIPRRIAVHFANRCCLSSGVSFSSTFRLFSLHFASLSARLSSSFSYASCRFLFSPLGTFYFENVVVVYEWRKQSLYQRFCTGIAFGW